MTYEEILNRDVPTIVEHSRKCACMGICSPIRLYYRHEAIAGHSTALANDLQADGWIDSGVEIGPGLSYQYYWRYIHANFGNVPLFA